MDHLFTHLLQKEVEECEGYIPKELLIAYISLVRKPIYGVNSYRFHIIEFMEVRGEENGGTFRERKGEVCVDSNKLQVDYQKFFEPGIEFCICIDPDLNYSTIRPGSFEGKKFVDNFKLGNTGKTTNPWDDDSFGNGGIGIKDWQDLLKKKIGIGTGTGTPPPNIYPSVPSLPPAPYSPAPWDNGKWDTKIEPYWAVTSGTQIDMGKLGKLTTGYITTCSDLIGSDISKATSVTIKSSHGNISTSGVRV